MDYLKMLNSETPLSTRDYYFVKMFDKLHEEYNLIKKEKLTENKMITHHELSCPLLQFPISKNVNINPFMNYTIDVLNSSDNIEYTFDLYNTCFQIQTVFDGFYFQINMNIVNVIDCFEIQIFGNETNRNNIISFIKNIYPIYLEDTEKYEQHLKQKDEEEYCENEDEELFTEKINQIISLLENDKSIEHGLQKIYRLIKSKTIHKRLMYRLGKRIIETILSLKYKLFKCVSFPIILYHCVEIYPIYSGIIYPILLGMVNVENVIQKRYVLKTLLYYNIVFDVETNRQFVLDLLETQNDIKITNYLLNLL